MPIFKQEVSSAFGEGEYIYKTKISDFIEYITPTKLAELKHFAVKDGIPNFLYFTTDDAGDISEFLGSLGIEECLYPPKLTMIVSYSTYYNRYCFILFFTETNRQSELLYSKIRDVWQKYEPEEAMKWEDILIKTFVEGMMNDVRKYAETIDVSHILPFGTVEHAFDIIATYDGVKFGKYAVRITFFLMLVMNSESSLLDIFKDKSVLKRILSFAKKSVEELISLY